MPLHGPAFESHGLVASVVERREDARVDLLPDGSTGLLYRLMRAGHADLAVLGPRTQAVYRRVPGLVLAVSVRFRPGGAYPFFGVPIDELAGRWVEARQLWGRRADRLVEELGAIGTAATPAHAAARRAAIEQALLERLHGPELFEPATGPIARAAVRRLGERDRPVAELAGELGVSERTLRRAFSAAVGISPKLFARIARFQRAVAAAPRARGRWAEVATSTGYVDQAHLIADFQALAGLSPAALVDGRAVEALRGECA